jgi:hypothetical protein
VRWDARTLVSCEPWPEDADTTGFDVAQLALLRVHHLQGQVRRAVRARIPDAAVQLARSALETSLVGLYSLHSEDAVGRLREANLEAAAGCVRLPGRRRAVPQEVMDEAVALLVASYRLPKAKARQLPQGSGRDRRREDARLRSDEPVQAVLRADFDVLCAPTRRRCYGTCGRPAP